MIVVAIALLAEIAIGVIGMSLIVTASDADKQQEPVYEDEKKHSGLLEED